MVNGLTNFLSKSVQFGDSTNTVYVPSTFAQSMSGCV